MDKKLAVTTDGKLTYCTSNNDNIGKGRCNHVYHQLENETRSEFMNRVENKENTDIIEIENIVNFDFSLPNDYFKDKNKDNIISEYTHIAAVNLRLKKAILIFPKYFFSKEINIPDPIALKNENLLFVDAKEKYELEINKMKEEHNDWYKIIDCQITIKPDEADKERAQKFVDSLETPDQKCYWYFKTKSELNQYKEFMKNKPEFTTTKKMLKTEFKEECNNIVKSIKEKTGYIGETEIKNKVPKITGTKSNQLKIIEIKLNNQIDDNLIWSFPKEELLESHVSIEDTDEE